MIFLERDKADRQFSDETRLFSLRLCISEQSKVPVVELLHFLCDPTIIFFKFWPLGHPTIVILRVNVIQNELLLLVNFGNSIAASRPDLQWNWFQVQIAVLYFYIFIRKFVEKWLLLPSLTTGNFSSEFARSSSQFASSLSVSNLATKSNGLAHGSHRAEIITLGSWINLKSK